MSNNHYRGILLITVAIISFSCQSQSQEKWIKDMEVHTYHGGGNVPESKTVIIKNSSGRYIHWVQQKTDTFNFSLSQQELNDLLKEINTDHFKNIISGETDGIAYDKPTTSVKFIWGKKIHEVNVGATEEIKKGNAQAFYSLYNYILALAAKKTGQVAE